MGGRVRKKKKNAIRTSEKQRFPTGFSMIGKKKKKALSSASRIYSKQPLFLVP